MDLFLSNLRAENGQLYGRKWSATKYDLIRPKEIPTTAATPTAFRHVTACSRDEPEPKFLHDSMTAGNALASPRWARA